MTSFPRGPVQIRNMNVIDMVLFDHRFLKECIAPLISEATDKNQKLAIARNFLSVLKKHFEAEQQILYSTLKSNEELHFNILEAEVEHGIIEEKMKWLRPRIAHLKVLRDEIEAELKVLAELVRNHLREEESELFPRMSEEVEEDVLMHMGEQFMKLRKITARDLRDYPSLHDELVNWKDEVQKVSSQFLSKMDRYVENLRH